jgi:hypothetical protein
MMFMPYYFYQILLAMQMRLLDTVHRLVSHVPTTQLPVTSNDLQLPSAFSPNPEKQDVNFCQHDKWSSLRITSTKSGV